MSGIGRATPSDYEPTVPLEQQLACTWSLCGHFMSPVPSLPTLLKCKLHFTDNQMTYTLFYVFSVSFVTLLKQSALHTHTHRKDMLSWKDQLDRASLNGRRRAMPGPPRSCHLGAGSPPQPSPPLTSPQAAIGIGTQDSSGQGRCCQVKQRLIGC